MTTTTTDSWASFVRPTYADRVGHGPRKVSPQVNANTMTDPQPTPWAISAEEMHRLRWQCRRGMLELDHLFMPFLERGYAALDADGRADFTRLLAQQDQDLSNWFMSRRDPEDPRLAAMVRRILDIVAVRRD